MELGAMENNVLVAVPQARKAFRGTVGFSVNKDEFEALAKVYGVSKPQELGVIAKKLLLANVNKVGGDVVVSKTG